MELPGVTILMLLASVRQANTVTNVALNKPAFMSSFRPSYPPSEAVDGDKTTFIHAEDASSIHWVEVDLLNSFSIHNVTITSRDCCGNRFRNFTIDLFSDHLPSGSFTTLCLYHSGSFSQFETKELSCQTPTVARRVRVTMWALEYLDIAEIEVKGRAVCGGYWSGFQLTSGFKRTDTALSVTEVESALACSIQCRKQIPCDAFQIVMSSSGMTCQLFTGRTGSNVIDNSYNHYHFIG